MTPADVPSSSETRAGELRPEDPENDPLQWPVEDASDASLPADAGVEVSVIQVLRDRTQAVPAIQLHEANEEDTPQYKPLGAGKNGEMTRRLGRYQVAGEIARGGMGVIYKARDVDLGRDIALKVLIEQFSGEPDMLQRFVEEAQIGGQLQHPGIVPVHEMGLVGGKTPYFAMKLVKGLTLSRLLGARDDPTTERQRFVGIFEQVCQTLAYAHARGVIHRDLKPSNIMVGAFGEVQVMDWGLAKVLASGGRDDDLPAVSGRVDLSAVETVRSGGTRESSLAGSVLGTPAYMAPEQARGELDLVAERSDVFGLGAILCEVLSGKPPYVGKGIEAVYAAATEGDLEGAYARLDACGADRELVTLAKRCLAIEPPDRPRDAGIVAGEIREYRESLEGRARALAVEAAEARVRVKAARKARALTLGLAAAVVIAVVIGAGAYLSIERQRQVAFEQVTARYHDAMAEAVSFRAHASALGTADPAPWNAARAAAERAASIARERDHAPELLEEVDSLLRQIDEEFRRQKFLARLESIFSATAYQRSTAIDNAYAAAFRSYLGADLLEMTPEEAAAKLSRVRDVETLAHALHTWADYAYRLGRGAERLFEIVDALDRDPWRRRFRQVSRTGGREEVLALVNDALAGTLSEPDFRALVQLLGRIRDPIIVQVVQRMLDLYPDSWWAQLAMGKMILATEPSRSAEALRYLHSSVVLAGGSRFGWSELGGDLRDAGEPRSALEAFLHGVRVSPGHSLFHGLVLQLLDASTVRDLGDSLDHCLELYQECLASDRPVGNSASLVLGFARAMRHEARGEVPRAVRALESADWSFPYPEKYERYLDSLRARLQPDLVSYASIDAALDPIRVLVPWHAPWRYLPGRRKPSEGIAWTNVHFRDGAWFGGEAGFGYGDGDDRTVLDDMRGAYTSVYIRREFECADPSEVLRLRLTVRVDDGFVAYLNGRELTRFNIRDSGIPSFDDTATTTLDAATTVEVDIPPDGLRPGTNVLAIQGLNASQDSSDLTLDPMLAMELSPASALTRGRTRLASFRREAAGENAPSRVNYFEARLLELEGRIDDATSKYRQILRDDPGAFEPIVHLSDCWLNRKPDATTVGEVRRWLSPSDRRFVPLWNRWLAASFAALGHAPSDVLPLLPAPAPTRPRAERSVLPTRRSSYPAELRSLLERLARGQAILINCGGRRYEGADGRVWLADCFFHGGDLDDAQSAGWLPTEYDGTDDDELYAEGRFFARDYQAGGGYRIPLPPGRYRVAIHFGENYFAQPSARVFDVLAEGKPVVEDYDCFGRVGFARADVRAADIEVTDGLLEIAFRWKKEEPRVAALEVSRLR